MREPSWKFEMELDPSWQEPARQLILLHECSSFRQLIRELLLEEFERQGLEAKLPPPTCKQQNQSRSRKRLRVGVAQPELKRKPIHKITMVEAIDQFFARSEDDVSIEAAFQSGSKPTKKPTQAGRDE